MLRPGLRVRVNEPRIRSAVTDDLPAVLALLRDARLPEDVEAHFEHFLVADDGGAIVGAVGLELQGSRALLRSLVIGPDRRASGIGKQLARAIVERAQAGGAEEIYLLTLDAAGFFERIGFRDVERATVPTEIRETREFRELCPATARLMKLISPGRE